MNWRSEKKEKKKWKGRKERNVDSGFIRVNGGEKSLIGPHNKKEQKKISVSWFGFRDCHPVRAFSKQERKKITEI